MSARFRTTARRLVVIFALLTLLAAFTVAQPAAAQTTPTQPFIDVTDPVSLIASYYNAISLRDYARAYNYWETPPQGQTLAQFSAGFANTGSVAAIVKLPYVSQGAAGSIYAELPTLVLARTTSSTVEIYAGCFTVRKSNVPVGDATEPDPSWRINAGTLQPANTTSLDLLNTACPDSSDLFSTYYDSLLSPSELAMSFFNALAQGDFNRAYNTWETPPRGQTLSQFSAGYVQTVLSSIRAYVYTGGMTTDAGAGNVYASLPIISTATTVNGANQFFAGCYIAHRSNVPVGDAPTPDPSWRWQRASVQTASSNANAILRVQAACAGM